MMKLTVVSCLLFPATASIEVAANVQRRPMPDSASDRPAFHHWQATSRDTLVQMLSIPGQCVALETQARGEFEAGNIVSEKWTLTLEADSETPTLVISPSIASDVGARQRQSRRRNSVQRCDILLLDGS